MTVTNGEILAAVKASEKLQDERHRTLTKSIEELKTTITSNRDDIEKKVESNRLAADDRHDRLSRKVWFGAGVIAALETIYQFALKK